MVLEKLRATRKTKVDNYIVALDIGTEFVKALISEVKGDTMEIIGAGRAHQELSLIHI